MMRAPSPPCPQHSPLHESIGYPATSLVRLQARPLGPIGSLDSVKDGVVIINTSRGANLDEAALLEALDSGKVRAAGLDVWATEPSTNAALYGHPHVSCTPHIGAQTGEAQARIGQEIVEIISSFGK